MALKLSVPLRLMTKLLRKEDSSRRLLGGLPPIIHSVGAKVFKGWGGRTRDEVKEMFEEWMIDHKKVYKSLAEKEKRFENFKKCLKIVENHNSTGNPSYQLGLSEFSDFTNEEFDRLYCSGLRVKTRKAS